jgi:hypothetical protein
MVDVGSMCMTTMEIISTHDKLDLLVENHMVHHDHKKKDDHISTWNSFQFK